MHANNGRGKVTVKNQIYLEDTILLNGSLTRHVKQSCWWVLIPDNNGTNNYYKVLLHDGKLIPKGNQEIGKIGKLKSNGHSGFNLDGTKYLSYSAFDGLSLMDFDRESGNLSVQTFPLHESIFNGAQFSPQARLYISNGPTSTGGADGLVADTIAIWDGKTATWGQPAYFGYMQTGQDCRIYMTTGYCVPFIHVIMEPDLRQLRCPPAELNVPTCNLPYFPNYRLGQVHLIAIGISK
ncbi:MAG: WD40 repeat domain-containing protein [Saprospiraceae bacterium]|nr:WD40 repeat domain-containing protein [Saprospiraceae bacterium]